MNRSTDDLDDLPLPQRPRRPDPRDMRGDARSSAREDLRDDMADEEREFTLSTGTVLALFFGLALICAVFFGFGYSMGHKSAAAAAAALPVDAPDNGNSATADTPVGTKPAAGAPAIQAIPGYQGSQKSSDVSPHSATAVPAPKATVASNGSTSVTVPMDNGSAATVKAKKPAVDPDGQIVEAPAKPALTRPVLTTATSAPTQPSVTALPAAGSGTVYVQISAVSHKEDADTLVAALRRRGYSVFTRPGANDSLIHVQVGPYANKKDAEVMRQKLMGDGYNAILK